MSNCTIDIPSINFSLNEEQSLLQQTIRDFVEGKLEKMGMRSSDTSELILEDVKI